MHDIGNREGENESMADQDGDRGEWNRAGWVFVVIACGAAIGGLLWFIHPSPAGSGPPPPGGPTGSTNLGQVAGIFSMVDLALLVSLIVVYVRTYLDTKARFALGLVLFLLALTVHTAASSVPVIGAFGFGFGGLGGFFLLSAGFESLALAIFLYLSLK